MWRLTTSEVDSSEAGEDNDGVRFGCWGRVRYSSVVAVMIVVVFGSRRHRLRARDTERQRQIDECRDEFKRRWISGSDVDSGGFSR